MNYKKYINSEVFTWASAPHHYTYNELLTHFSEHPYESINCLAVRDYIDNPDNPELELYASKCIIQDITKEDCGYIRIEFVIGKIKPEMKDNYDIYSKPYIKLFSESDYLPFYSSDDIYFCMKLAIGIPVFMQKSDERLIQKPLELQPMWYQIHKNNLKEEK